MPQVGEPALFPAKKETPKHGYQSTFSHDDESASAGYYKVKLAEIRRDGGADRRRSRGHHALHLSGKRPSLDLTDLNHVLQRQVLESRSRVCAEDNSTVTGFHLVNGWAKERYLYFAARYSRPFDEGTDHQRRQARDLQHLSLSQPQ